MKIDKKGKNRNERSKLDRRVRAVLMLGMVTSIILLLTGLMLYAIEGKSGENALSLGNIPGQLLKGDPIAIMCLGIIVLLATPVLRVVTIIFTMAEQRETYFMLTALAVLSFLLLSFLLATLK